MERKGRYLAPAMATTALLALGGTACGGGKQTCESPPAVSREFAGDPKAVQNNQNTWNEGVEIDTGIPVSANSLDIAYTDPGGNWHGELVPADEADRLKVRIGPESVSFRVKLVADKNSSICGDKPETRFTQKSYNDIQDATPPDPHGYKSESPY